MIEHSYIVQYCISAKLVDGEWVHDDDSWSDDSNYEFRFDTEDEKDRELARAAATASVLWLQHQDKVASEDDTYCIPFRVVHRITSDEVL